MCIHKCVHIILNITLTLTLILWGIAIATPFWQRLDGTTSDSVYVAKGFFMSTCGGEPVSSGKTEWSDFNEKVKSIWADLQDKWSTCKPTTRKMEVKIFDFFQFSISR